MTILKFGNKKKLLKALIIVCFSFCLIMVCSLIMGEGRELIRSTATCDEIGSYETKASDFLEQSKFLEQFGIIVTKKGMHKDSVTIPETFNETYKRYNQLQKKAGLNLVPYRGKEVSRITYRIKNQKVYVILLVYKGYAIGGHISTGIYGDSYKSLI